MEEGHALIQMLKKAFDVDKQPIIENCYQTVADKFRDLHLELNYYSMTTVDAYLLKLSAIVSAYHLDAASCQLTQKEKDDLWNVFCDSIRTHKDSKHQTVVRNYQAG